MSEYTYVNNVNPYATRKNPGVWHQSINQSMIWHRQVLLILLYFVHARLRQRATLTQIGLHFAWTETTNRGRCAKRSDESETDTDAVCTFTSKQVSYFVRQSTRSLQTVARRIRLATVRFRLLLQSQCKVQNSVKWTPKAVWQLQPTV